MTNSSHPRGVIGPVQCGRPRPEAEVAEPAANRLVELAAVSELVQVDGGVGMLAMPAGQRGGQNADRHRGDRGQLQLSARGAQGRPRGFGGAGRVGGRGAGLGQERPPGLGQLHAVGQALQQRSAELTLQRADLLGERRLGDREPLGGARERPLFDDRQQVGDLAQIHFTAP